MDIYEEFHNKYTELDYAIMNISDKEVKAEVEAEMKRYSGIWESGNSLTHCPWNFSEFPKRKPEDEEKELELLLKWVSDTMWKLVIKAWVKPLKREELVQSMNVIALLEPRAKISICGTHSADITQIVDIWNKEHPEDFIYKMPEFEK